MHTTMQPTPTTAPPAGDQWAHEVKWDGVRCLATIHPDGEVRLCSRRGRDLTGGFGDIAHHLTGLATPAGDITVDGELIQLVDGRPDFHAVMRHVGRRHGDSGATLVLFDLPTIAGRPHPGTWTQRRVDLADLADGLDQVTVSTVFDDGAALHAATREQRLEGVVSKRRDSRYRPGRTRDWVKAKHTADSAHVVVGLGRDGKVLVASPGPDGQLRLDGAVAGAGSLTHIRATCVPVGACPLPLARPPRGVRWVRPDLLVTVRSLASSDRLREGRVVTVGRQMVG